MVFLATTWLLPACGGASQDAPTLSLQVLGEIVEDGCTEEGLALLEGFAASEVVAGLLEWDQELKRTEWTEKISHGHPIDDLGWATPLLSGFDFDYSLYVPPGYDPDHPLPLYFDPGHPTDALQDDLTLPYQADLLDSPVFFVQDNLFNRLYTELGPEAYEDQVLNAPALDQVGFYQDHEALVAEILRQVRRDFAIDSTRLYVGGVSAQGNAAWAHGILSSDQWAGIVPVSAGTAAYDEDYYRNLEHVGILVVHGTEDTLVAVEGVDQRVERLEGWGFDIEYWREEGEGHGTMFFREFSEMMDWLLQRTRPTTPDHVRFSVASERSPSRHWLKIQSTEAPLDDERRMVGSAVTVSAEGNWTAGEVQLTATGVDTLDLLWLEGESGAAGQGQSGDALVVSIDGTSLGSFALSEDPTLPARSYCSHADTTRLWSGSVTLVLP